MKQKRLTKEEKYLISIMRFMGYTQEEIAKKLGVTKGTVHYHLREKRKLAEEKGIELFVEEVSDLLAIKASKALKNRLKQILQMKKDIQLINLTPHTVTIVDEESRKILEVPPSGQVARVEVMREPVGTLNGVPLVHNRYGDVQGLPEPREGTVYIVSLVVLQALQGKRNDVVAPDTSPAGAVRDEEGRIIGVKAFVVP